MKVLEGRSRYSWQKNFTTKRKTMPNVILDILSHSKLNVLKYLLTLGLKQRILTLIVLHKILSCWRKHFRHRDWEVLSELVSFTELFVYLLGVFITDGIKN